MYIYMYTYIYTYVYIYIYTYIYTYTYIYIYIYHVWVPWALGVVAVRKRSDLGAAKGRAAGVLGVSRRTWPEHMALPTTLGVLTTTQRGVCSQLS